MSAYYVSSVRQFLRHDPASIVGDLANASANTGFLDLKQAQTRAWKKQIRILKSTLGVLVTERPKRGEWALLLEYPIPRRQKRIDAVLLARDVIFCIEFKTEATKHNLQAQKQAEDYALDLRDFHSKSLGRTIVPMAVSSNALSRGEDQVGVFPDLVQPARVTNAHDLAKIIADVYRSLSNPTHKSIAAKAWNGSAYSPVPTIIEAAEALYAGHDVSDIAHHHAGDKNLKATSHVIIELIKRAQKKQQKIVCFVTGIPGAGKTLAGLNVVHNPVLREEGRTPGVFLSGNGPLVRIIRSALERDHVRRDQDGDPKRHTKTFIQNVHEFIRVERKRRKSPNEHVLVFDEAQRAWNAEKNFEKNHDKLSEPERLLSIMNRHPWTVVVALVGGGQEIHRGEAGVAEWGNALLGKFSNWKIAVSPEALSGH